MTKRIYFLRHAQAESSYEYQDRDRPLTELGRSQAAVIGSYFKEKNLVLDKILSSSAVRTTQTLDHLGLDTSKSSVSVEPRLYNADEKMLEQFFMTLENTVNSVLVIGHNPGLFHAAYAYSKESDNCTVFSYDLAMLCVFEANFEHWADFAERKIRCIDIIHPNITTTPDFSSKFA
ncbi:MAG: hypothetical protein CL565_04845 [Alphaproteobacteria bacterium]|nr:hypothetical protein [Alphaproteobacteria bacterium]